MHHLSLRHFTVHPLVHHDFRLLSDDEFPPLDQSPFAFDVASPFDQEALLFAPVESPSEFPFPLPVDEPEEVASCDVVSLPWEDVSPVDEVSLEVEVPPDDEMSPDDEVSPVDEDPPVEAVPFTDDDVLLVCEGASASVPLPWVSGRVAEPPPAPRPQCWSLLAAAAPLMALAMSPALSRGMML